MSSELFNRPHNYYNNPPSNYWKVLVADSIGLVVALVVVTARYYTKLYITKAPGWEDHISLMSFIAFGTFTVLDYVRAFEFGAGRHTWDLPPELYNGNLTISAVCTYLYVLGIMLAKVSLLLFLYRIFRVNRKFRIVSWIIGIVVVIWSTVSFLLFIFSCRPIQANWNVKLYLDPKTHCSPKVYNVVTIQGFCNIITDFGLLVLPIPLVWNLQMNMKKKLGLATVFASGMVICAISIVRQYILYNTEKNADNWDGTRSVVWLSIEFSLSIIVASLPSLAPLLKRLSVLSSIIPSSIRNRSRNTPKSFKKSSGPDADVELGNRKQPPHSSWEAPKAWKEPHRKQSFDTRASDQSEMTLQPVRPTHRELNHKD